MQRVWVLLAMVLVACGDGGGPTEPASAPGGSAAPAASTPRPAAANRAPSVTIGIVEPSWALLRVTRVALAATAEDPDGDALVYTWDFGDGEGEKGGAGIAHVFDKAGDVEVSVTADDSRGGTARARRTVQVRTLSGAWHGLISPGPHGGWRIGGNLAQTGRTFQVMVTAHTGDGAGDPRPLAISAVLYDPRDMVVTVPLCGDVTFRGSWNETFDTFIADGPGCAQDYTRLEMYR